MSETYTKLGVPLVSKDKDPVLNAQAQYHTYVRCELAAIISFAAAVRGPACVDTVLSCGCVSSMDGQGVSRQHVCLCWEAVTTRVTTGQCVPTLSTDSRPTPNPTPTTQLLLLSMALLRVGSLMKLISPSVLTGFVTGSGVYIFFTQSKYIWGFKVRTMMPVCVFARARVGRQACRQAGRQVEQGGETG
jgi:hypothetical protein